jgi:hypothetical protein
MDRSMSETISGIRGKKDTLGGTDTAGTATQEEHTHSAWKTHRRTPSGVRTRPSVLARFRSLAFPERGFFLRSISIENRIFSYPKIILMPD